MTPDELRYDSEKALRYSDPPSVRKVENNQQALFAHYAAVTHLRNAAKEYYRTLVQKGIFESIPTLTAETKKGRPGTFWRAVFRTNSPEVNSGSPRKHYIGSDPAKLQHWQHWIDRTRLAMDLNQLIADIGHTLKDQYRTINRAETALASYIGRYTTRLENLTP